MRVETSAVAHAPVEEVWRWWTDYGRAGETRTVSHGFLKNERKILHADGNRLTLEERIPLPLGKSLRVVRHEVEIDETAHRLIERGREGPIPYESEWRFEPDPANGGTRIRRTLTSDARAADALARVGARLVERAMRADMEAHVREFERERR